MSNELAIVKVQTIAEIALAFCKECRGWENARGSIDWGYPFIQESVSKELADTSVFPYERHFHYTHLDKVMEAVREWLMASSRYPIPGSVMAYSFVDYFDGKLDQAGLCRELMSVCVNASRQGKEKQEHA